MGNVERVGEKHEETGGKKRKDERENVSILNKGDHKGSSCETGGVECRKKSDSR